MPAVASDIEIERERVRSVIEAYRRAWLSFDPPVSNDAFPGLNDCLYVIEFQAPGCDLDELRQGFTVAVRALEVKLFGACRLGHIFQMNYVPDRPNCAERLVRALALVHPHVTGDIEQAAQTITQGRLGLSIVKCDTDHGDPDSHWRWLAEGISGR